MSVTNEDEKWMRLALREAAKAKAQGEVPVGAVVVRSGKIVGRGFNRSVGACDPSAHAEIIALRAAAGKTGNYRLSECDLYVILEPCAMCLGAVVLARIRRLVYGASDPKTGAVASIMRFPFAKMNHRPRVRGGVLAGECGRALKEFFLERRGKKTVLRRTGAERCPSG